DHHDAAGHAEAFVQHRVGPPFIGAVASSGSAPAVGKATAFALSLAPSQAPALLRRTAKPPPSALPSGCLVTIVTMPGCSPAAWCSSQAEGRTSGNRSLGGSKMPTGPWSGWAAGS